MVVDVLSLAVSPRDHDRYVSRASGREDAPHACVRDDDVGLGDACPELLERQERDGDGDAGRRPRVSILDDQLRAGQQGERFDQPVEGLVMRAEGDEYHSTLPS
jgi:hypothetical protein